MRIICVIIHFVVPNLVALGTAYLTLAFSLGVFEYVTTIKILCVSLFKIQALSELLFMSFGLPTHISKLFIFSSYVIVATYSYIATKLLVNSLMIKKEAI